MLLMIIILFLFYFMTIVFYHQANTLIGFVGSQIVAQTQVGKDMGPISPVQ